jgi:diacylglycerol kinase
MEALKNSNNKNFFKSFYFAISGLKLAFKEWNFKIFCFVALLVIALMFIFKVSFLEKAILILTISFTMA